MSDNSISIVPKQSNYPDNKAKAKEILDWLIAEDIVKPTLSNCILSSEKQGYAVSNGARKVTDASGYGEVIPDKTGEPGFKEIPDYIPTDLMTNGLEIITEREVFDTGANFVDELICPSCQEDIVEDDWDLTPWSDQESNNLTCPHCGHETDINNFTFDPEWGFSNLGFKFWNWPEFTPAFINDFKEKLGCDIAVVSQHI